MASGRDDQGRVLWRIRNNGAEFVVPTEDPPRQRLGCATPDELKASPVGDSTVSVGADDRDGLSIRR